MRTNVSQDGPGPMVLRASHDNDDVPMGSVLINFYPERAELSIVADNATAEAMIRARVDAWVVDRACGMLRERTNALSRRNGCCRCHRGEQA